MAARNVDQQLTEVASLRMERDVLLQRAFLLEYATLAWMTIEAAVAIGSGLVAHSLVLVAFGIDSVIELASATVLLWRLKVELRHGELVAENAEKAASRTGGSLLFLLAAYVVAAAGWKLWTRQGAEFSLLGFLVSVLTIPIMYILSRRKLTLAQQLGSRALRTDAIESVACGWLAIVVAAALTAQLILGAWWVDAIASLPIVWLLFREGQEAWEGQGCCARRMSGRYVAIYNPGPHNCGEDSADQPLGRRAISCR